MKITPDGVVKLLDFGLAKAFSEPVTQVPGFRYDVAPDGKRFLVITRPTAQDASASGPITVVLNWTTGLKR